MSFCFSFALKQQNIKKHWAARGKMMLLKPLRTYTSCIIFLGIYFVNLGNLLVGQKAELKILCWYNPEQKPSDISRKSPSDFSRLSKYKVMQDTITNKHPFWYTASWATKGAKGFSSPHGPSGTGSLRTACTWLMEFIWVGAAAVPHQPYSVRASFSIHFKTG